MLKSSHQSIVASFCRAHLGMENDANEAIKANVIDQYGRKSASSPLETTQPLNDAGFLSQVSNNPFFTAVSGAYTNRVH